MIEIIVKVSDSEKTLRVKTLVYNPETPISLEKDDPALRELVDRAIEQFKGPVEDVLVTIKMCW